MLDVSIDDINIAEKISFIPFDQYVKVGSADRQLALLKNQQRQCIHMTNMQNIHIELLLLFCILSLGFALFFSYRSKDLHRYAK